MKTLYWICLGICLLFIACKNDEVSTPAQQAFFESVTVNGRSVYNGATVYNVPVDSVVIDISFSSAVDKSKIDPSKFYVTNGVDTAFSFVEVENTKTLRFKIRKPMAYYSVYSLNIDQGEQMGVNLIESFSVKWMTQLDSRPKFPIISNDSLLTLVQKQTFRYFWDYAHPVSGLARERLGSGETVTAGGSGFGLMTIPVAIERGFITRNQGLERMQKVVSFLKNTAERFHGAYPHWLNGTSGKVQPFSTKDNGADLVETAFLMQGLLAVQQYFQRTDVAEKNLSKDIQSIWEGVEWNWFQKNGEQKLYWHWSPTYNWDMNMPVTGWNEGLIVYVLAASSPTYPISKSVYENGFARNGAIKNGKKYFGITLPLGEDNGGPLFFSHYSFLGLDPRKLQDSYANYWEQNTAHANINYQYCVSNPHAYFGYSSDCWGLTASDIPDGYTASSPSNDVGVIAPTAALSSFPYTPAQSLKALRFFYYTVGDQLWGEYGFKDAFHLGRKWFAPSYLAIDQGPVVVMLENYRSGLLWNLFMQHSNVRTGLSQLGFTY